MPSLGRHTLSITVVAAAIAAVSPFAAGTAMAADPVTAEAAPTLVAPANDAAGTTPLKDVVLDWTPVDHAASYQVQVSPNGDWTNNTVTLPDGGVTVNDLYEMPVSLPHATYFWRVRALGAAGGHTAYSAVRTFFRDWYVPITMLSTPSDTDPSLSWAPVARASLYRVRFSTRPDFSGTVFACTTAATSFTPYDLDRTAAEPGDCFSENELVDGTTYYWELMAYDNSSAPAVEAETVNDPGWECAQALPECDAAFETGSFTFDSAETGAQSGSTVTGLATTWQTATTTNDCTADICPVTPTFSWTPVPGANLYRVHVYRDAFLSNTYKVFTTSRPHLTPRAALFDAQAGTPYFWTVEAGWCRNSGTDGQCSTAAPGSAPTSPSCASSTNATPAPSIDPSGLNPTQMNAGDVQTITIDGTNFASNACVKADEDAGLISNVVVQSANQITFDYQAPGSPQAVKFKVVNPDGGTSNASPTLAVSGEFNNIDYWAVSGLATFEKQSGSVNLTQPANNATVSDRSVTFDWSNFQSTGGSDAFDARDYRIQVAKDANFDDVRWDVDGIDMSRFTNPNALLGDGHWFWRVQAVDESGNHLTWSAAHQFTKDSKAPVFTLTDSSPASVTGALHVVANDTIQGVVSQTTLHVVPLVGGGAPVAGSWDKTAANRWTFDPSGVLVPGQSYGLEVVPGTLSDAAGNDAVASNSTVRTSGRVDDRNPAWSYSSGWTRHSSSNAVGHTFSSAAAGKSASVKVRGTSVSVLGCRGPHFGTVKVFVDGNLKATVNEHRSFTGCDVVLWKGSVSNSAVHTVKVSNVGAGAIDAVRVG